MIEIAISSELAAAHPNFVAGCARRGLRVEVFADSGERGESPGAPTPDADRVADAAYVGRPHPVTGYYAECTGAFSTDPDEFCGCPICQAARSVADL